MHELRGCTYHSLTLLYLVRVRVRVSLLYLVGGDHTHDVGGEAAGLAAR